MRYHLKLDRRGRLTSPCAKIERFSVPIEIEREAVSPVRDPSRRTRFYAPRKPVQARFTRERILPYPPRGNALYGLSGSMYDAPYTQIRLCPTCIERRTPLRAELGRQARLQHVVNGPKGCPNFGTTFGNKDNEMQSKGGLCKLLPSNWNDELLRQEAERHPTPNEIMGAKIAAEGFLRARSHDNIQWS